MPMKNVLKGFFVVSAMLIMACEGETYLPKPKGYNRIDLPEKLYQPMPDTFPYQMQYSKHAQLLKDSSWISERYWVDLYYPYFDASVELSYKPILKSDQLNEEFISTSYRLTAQHNVKAYAIEEVILELPNGDFASYSELTGHLTLQF